MRRRRVLACVIALLTVVAPHNTPLRRIPLRPRLRTRPNHSKERVLEGSGSRSSLSGGTAIVPITNFADVQYVGTIEVGTAKTSILVVFDTGSSDLWVQTQSCKSLDPVSNTTRSCCALGGTRVKAQTMGTAPQCGLDVAGEGDLSPSNCTDTEIATCMNEPPDQRVKLPVACFCCSYGSGTVAGKVGHTRIQLMDFLIPEAELGLVEQTNANFASFQSDGIVGMAFPALATLPSQSTLFGLLLKANPSVAPVFSFYLSPAPDATPRSELIIGGYDLNLAAPGARWEYATVYPSENGKYYYWTVILRSVLVRDASSNATVTGGDVSSTPSPAIVDTGSSFFLLPHDHFEQLVSAIFGQLFQSGTCVYNDDACATGEASVDCSVLCSAALNPSTLPNIELILEPGVVLALRGSDYMILYEEPTGTVLYQLAISVGQSTILGDTVIRAFMVLFDVGDNLEPCSKPLCQPPRVGFACTGACSAPPRPSSGLTSGQTFGVIVSIAAVLAGALWIAQRHCMRRQRQRHEVTRATRQAGLAVPLVHADVSQPVNPVMNNPVLAFARQQHVSPAPHMQANVDESIDGAASGHERGRGEDREDDDDVALRQALRASRLEQNLGHLCDMGFGVVESTAALERHDNLQQAAEELAAMASSTDAADGLSGPTGHMDTLHQGNFTEHAVEDRGSGTAVASTANPELASSKNMHDHYQAIAEHSENI